MIFAGMNAFRDLTNEELEKIERLNKEAANRTARLLDMAKFIEANTSRKFNFIMFANQAIDHYMDYINSLYNTEESTKELMIKRGDVIRKIVNDFPKRDA